MPECILTYFLLSICFQNTCYLIIFGLLFCFQILSILSAAEVRADYMKAFQATPHAAAPTPPLFILLKI
ncbi:MAG: hypothetical protein IJ187_03485 [Neisseriaceae bacterium]|nr:hypothetical protein [Neisseriaceae bacterium]